MGEHSIGNYYRPINRPIVKTTKDFNPFDEEEALQRLRAKSRRNALTRFWLNRKLKKANKELSILLQEETALFSFLSDVRVKANRLSEHINFLRSVLMD